MLLILIGSYVLAERGKPFWSGAVLGLALQKFHLLLLLPPAMLLRRSEQNAVRLFGARSGDREIVVPSCAPCSSGIQGMRDSTLHC